MGSLLSEEDPTHNWVNKYMQSSKYEILDNEGGGDCFFAVLRDALKTAGKVFYNPDLVKDPNTKLELARQKSINTK